MILLDFKKYIFPVKEDIFDFIEVKNTRLKPFREWFLENVNNFGSCPKCGKPLTVRKNRANNVEFLGCTGYPNCTHTAGYNPNVAKQIAAAPTQGVQQTPQQGVKRSSKWFYADVIAKDDVRFKNLEKVAVKKRDEDTWDCYVLLTGKTHIIPTGKLKALFRSIVGTDGKQISTDYTPSIEDLRSKDPGVAHEYENDGSNKPVDNRMIPEDLMSEEQRAIDAKFENMLKSGQDHLMINALSGTGKAQPLYSNILSENGWIKMGDIKTGDKVFGSDGNLHDVVGVFPQGNKEVYKIHFSDGTSVDACEDHLWLTETVKDRADCKNKNIEYFSKSIVKTTKEIKNSLTYCGKNNHYIPLVKSINFKEQELPLDAYLMGVLLGDGSFCTGGITYSTVDNEIMESVNQLLPEEYISVHKGGCDYRIVTKARKCKENLVKRTIKDLGLYETKSDKKFIPDIYKFNSTENRIKLLQGLLDTDGGMSKNLIEYSTCSKQLADGICFLVQSLGGTAVVGERHTFYTYKDVKKQGKLSYRIRIKLPDGIVPFRLKRKIDIYKPPTKYKVKRTIVDVTYVGSIECQCISVNSKDNLYITDNFTLTHNTTLLKHLAWKYGKAGQKWLYLVFNTKNKIEASEKFPTFVQVRTTNGFLGEVLGSKDNINKISKTDRLAVLEAKNRNEESEKKLEKARMLVDGKAFSEFMNSLKMTEAIPSHVRIDSDYEFNAVKSLLKSIRYSYKEQVLTLAGLAKAYALDPRNDEKLQEGFKKILSDYDFDTSLEEVQEKIAGWNNNFRAIIIEILNDIFETDFEHIDFSKEIIQGATWLMKEGMPGVTLQKYTQKDKDHNLSDYRDFNDDLWYSATHAEDINWPKFDIVLVDEVQDFNEAQKIMLKKLIDRGTKIVAVGDPNQSLYRFRGADSKSFSNIESLLQDKSSNKNVTQKLTSNFRSRKKIIDFANSETHVKNLKGGKKFNDNNDGNVTKFEQTYGEVFSAMSSEQQEKGKVKETAFIARTNEPLIHAALKLLANNIKFVILGKDIAKDLIKQLGKVVFKFKLKDTDPTRELSNLIDKYVDDEKEKHSGQSTKKVYLQELKEVCDAILGTLSQFESERGGGNQYISIGEYKKWISIKLGGFNIEESEADYNAYKEKMKKEKPVVLTTAHRSKGLEFERVYLLRYDLFPHKKAKREEDLEQEENARYVAITRAQDELHIIKLEGQPGYKGKQEDDADVGY